VEQFDLIEKEHLRVCSKWLSFCIRGREHRLV